MLCYPTRLLYKLMTEKFLFSLLRAEIRLNSSLTLLVLHSHQVWYKEAHVGAVGRQIPTTASGMYQIRAWC